MFNNKKIKQLEIKIEILNNHIQEIWKKSHEWVEETETRLNELEKIVKNQPLIKKYQKTLDIFLKNAQD